VAAGRVVRGMAFGVPAAEAASSDIEMLLLARGWPSRGAGWGEGGFEPSRAAGRGPAGLVTDWSPSRRRIRKTSVSPETSLRNGSRKALAI
jgi:hypothetical protein